MMRATTVEWRSCLSVMGALCLVGGAVGAAPKRRSPKRRWPATRTAVRALLKQGVDVNAAQGDGMTALHWAARQGDVELAQMLLYAGANVKATTRLGGYTPLIMAAQIGSAPMIETLLKAGADPKAATTNGTTPLMLAAASGTGRRRQAAARQGRRSERQGNGAR